jgi:A/G-specific adenine glycosylase
MLQQTRMEVVLPRYQDFVTRFPTLRALAAASKEEVTAAWSGLGYYRRARMLRQGAAAVVERFAGQLPGDVSVLQTISGIGRYTAGAIASIAYDQPAPIVDGNIMRITARLFAINVPLRSTALARQVWKHAEELVKAAKSPRVFNQALMEIGALICRPKNPLCGECPLRRDCAAFSRGRVERYPRKAQSKPKRSMRIPLYLIVDGKGRVLMQRESGPLMDGMFHLPHGNHSLIRGSRVAVRGSRRVGTFRHTITNRRITFEVFISSRPPTRDLRPATWIHPRELSEVPHPSYVRKALQLAGMTE